MSADITIPSHLVIMELLEYPSTLPNLEYIMFQQVKRLSTIQNSLSYCSIIVN
jgi:hypothetical protein